MENKQIINGKLILLLSIFLGLCVLAAYATAPNPGHDASQIGSGAFNGTSSDIWSFPGSVGIGTANPDYKLTVAGYAKVGSGIDGEYGYLWGNPGNLWNLYKPVGSTDLILLSYGAGGNVMTFKADNGSVGIGTTAPLGKLHVYGDEYIGVGAVTYPSTPTGAWANLILKGSTVDERFVMNDGTGNFQQYLNSYYDSSSATHKYTISSTANRFTTTAGTFAFYVAPSGTAGNAINWTTGLYIGNTGNVGIGTTAPAQTLSVAGTGNVSGALYLGNSMCASGYVLTADPTTGLVNCTAGGTGSGGGSYWNLSGSSLYPNSTTYNVGIGTTGPTHALDVSVAGTGTAVLSTFLEPLLADSNYVLWDLGKALSAGQSGGVVYGLGTTGNSYADSYIGFVHYGDNPVTQSLSIKKGGNVGIGTTSPANQLDILTNANSGSGVRIYGDQNKERFVAESGVPVFQAGKYDGTYTSKTPVQSGDALGYFQTGGYDGTTQTFNEARMIGLATETHTATNHGTSLQFQTIANGGTAIATKMTIDNSGNVGIGTTNPVATVSTRKALVVADTTNDATIEVWGVLSSKGQLENVGGNTYMGNTALGTGNGNTVLTYGAGSIGLTILGASGNVGINTTSPAQTLTVAGTGNVSGALYLGNSKCASGYVLTADPTTGLVNCTAGGTGSGGGSYWNLSGSSLYPNSTTYNVGIGTATPRGNLEVVSGTANTNADPAKELTVVGPNNAMGLESGNLEIATNDAVAADMGGSLAFGARYSGTAQANFAVIKAGMVGSYGGYMSLATRPDGGVMTERIRILSGGNVGIGTASPGGMLDIVKTQSSGTTQEMFRTAFDVNWGLRLVQDYVGAGDIKYELKEKYSGTEYDVLAFKAGSVGIGTVSPGAALEVNGGVRLNTATARPTCDSSQRGTFWVVKSGSGSADLVYVCLKMSTDAYQWVLVARGN